MSSKYQVFTEQVSAANKSRSADALIVSELAEENILLVAVADGGVSIACGWDASQTACSVTASTFASGTGPVAERIRQSILQAHQSIRESIGERSGMQATLAVAVWEKDTDVIHYACIGDSRIYLFGPRYFRQLKQGETATALLKSDQKSEPVKSEIEPESSDAKPLTAVPPSRIIGREESLAFSVFQDLFVEGQSLVLATDGMHGGGRFIRAMLSLLDQQMPGSQLPGFVGNQSTENSDDATLVVVRRSDRSPTASQDLEKCVAEQKDIRSLGVPSYIAASIISEKLLQCALDGSSETADRYLDYLERFRIPGDSEGLAQVLTCLSLAMNPDQTLIMRIRKLIPAAP